MTIDRLKFRYVWMHRDTQEVKSFIVTIDDLESDTYAGIESMSLHWRLISRDQFTGLTDREGVEVYENDIVKAHCFDMFGGDREIVGVVTVAEDGAYTIDLADMSIAFVSTSHWEEPCIEVLGNEHENPDLLTQESND